MHIPVLLHQVLNVVPKEGKIAFDFTFGMAGHSLAVVDKFPNYQVWGFDRDNSTIGLTNDLIWGKPIKLNQLDFKAALDFIADHGLKADFIIADFGVSSMQLDCLNRGFSFNLDGPLDMRMNSNDSLSALEVVNEYSLQQLIDLLIKGEETYAQKIANAIVETRKKIKISSTLQLSSIVLSVKKRIKRWHHPSTLTFQAIRMHVNDELEQIDYLLKNVLNYMQKNGVLAFISFNSLEDRIVKRQIQIWLKTCICPIESPICVCNNLPKVKLLSKKSLIADANEIAVNVRSRSAKLRVVEKI